MWGLAAYGADGVQGVIEMLQTELARYMGMCGKSRLARCCDRTSLRVARATGRRRRQRGSAVGPIETRWLQSRSRRKALARARRRGRGVAALRPALSAQLDPRPLNDHSGCRASTR